MSWGRKDDVLEGRKCDVLREGRNDDALEGR